MTTTRIGWALAASLALHLVVLLPASWWHGWLPRTPAPPPPLSVQLLAPDVARELATRPEVSEKPPGAVLPAPTFKPADKPRKLKGRALETAMAALALEEFYPREAIERGWEGRVVLLLTLDAEGRIAAIEVASSSGHLVLDSAALRAATRIVRLSGGRRQVLLPVEFRLE